MRRRCCIWCAGLAVSIATAGQSLNVSAQNADAPEHAFFEGLPVVLSVSRLPQSLADTPGAVTVIDRGTIRATGYRRLPDLLRLVPGFNVAYLRGWEPVANYHGFSGEMSNRVLVLIDGRPINSEVFSGATDWISQPRILDDIERIEVLRGFNSAAYGANAFLGVINVITAHASQGEGVYAQLNEGDHGISDKILRLGASFDKLDLRLSVAQTHDEGLDNLRDGSRQSLANFRADLRPTDSDELTLNVGAQTGPGGEGFVTEPANPARDRTTRSDFQQLRWRHVFTPDNELSLQYYRNSDTYIDEVQVDLRQLDLSGLPAPVRFLVLMDPMVPFDQNRETTRESIELQHNYRFSPTLRTVWGAESRRDKATSPTFFDSREPVRRRMRRLFGNLEWRPTEPLALNVGVLAEKVDGAETAVSPRVFVNYEMLPGHVVRGGVSTAKRSPTLFETYGRLIPRLLGQPVPGSNILVGNPDLKQESVRAEELGYFGRIPELRLQADVRIYRERLRDLIATGGPVPAQLGLPDSATSFTNLSEAQTRGIEYQLKFRPFPTTELALGQAFERIDHEEAEKIGRSAPTHSTSVMWTQQLPAGVSFSLMHYAVGPIHWQNFGDLVEGYRRTDARLSYRLREPGFKGELSLVGLNLFDRYNEFRNGIPPETHAFGRRVYVTLRLDY